MESVEGATKGVALDLTSEKSKKRQAAEVCGTLVIIILAVLCLALGIAVLVVPATWKDLAVRAYPCTHIPEALTARETLTDSRSSWRRWIRPTS